MKVLGLKLMLSLSAVSISFLMSTELFSGFSMVINLVTVSLTIVVSSSFFYGSGGCTVRFLKVFIYKYNVKKNY